MLRVLHRAGGVLGRIALVVAALAATEVVAAPVAFSVGMILIPVAPFIVAGGVLAGCAALVVGAVRAHRGAASGGISGSDALVHAVLLANTAVLAWLSLAPRAIASDWLLLVGLAAAATALVGVPVSVWLSWMRAFTAPADPPAPSRRWVLRASHAANLALAVGVLVTSGGGAAADLLGSAAG